MVAVFTEEPRSWATHQPIARTAGLVHTGQHPQPMMWTTITQPVVASFPRAQTLEPINDIPLTRSLLKIVLNDLSERLYHSFRRQVRLIVHGGAVMVLHPSFTHRESTQDINYVHRAFVSEYRALSFTDAEERLRSCIVQTAAKFNLGADWMNGHTDIALPMALDQYGRTYDPIFNVSTRSENSVPQTIFNERGLALVAVPWAWALALKLVRYAKQDPVDCAAVLRLGFSQRGIRWTLAGLEQWIMERCWPMGYSGYQPPQRAQLRQRMQDALTRAFPDGTQSLPSLPSSSLPSSSPPSLSLPSSPLSLLSSLPSLSSSLPSTPSLSVSPLPLSLPLSSSVHQQLLRMTSNSEKPSYFSQVVPYIENADTSFSYYDITSQNPEQQETRSRDR
ncbi:hypothetical protein EI94DRAFT_1754022 [Lactarius quietus]|nr:hypothetical protein EI94DRAFT_1754022 [Lactarius quietus]